MLPLNEKTLGPFHTPGRVFFRQSAGRWQLETTKDLSCLESCKCHRWAALFTCLLCFGIPMSTLTFSRPFALPLINTKICIIWRIIIKNWHQRIQKHSNCSAGGEDWIDINIQNDIKDLCVLLCIKICKRYLLLPQSKNIAILNF